MRLEFGTIIANPKGPPMTNRPRRTLPGLLLFAAIIHTAPAIGQTGNDPLAAICQGFLSSSGLPSPGNSSVLCSCLVREVQTSLTLTEMQAYQSATAAGRALPAQVQNKITSIATRCLNAAR